MIPTTRRTFLRISATILVFQFFNFLLGFGSNPKGVLESLVKQGLSPEFCQKLSPDPFLCPVTPFYYEYE